MPLLVVPLRLISNNITIIKLDFRNFLTQYILQFSEMHNSEMHNVAVSLWPINYMLSYCGCRQFVIFQIITCKFCHLCLVRLLLHRIGNLLEYVAVLYLTSVCRLLSVRGREGRA